MREDIVTYMAVAGEKCTAYCMTAVDGTDTRCRSQVPDLEHACGCGWE